eukprot:5679653-Amphidinium_carterae.1
MSVLAVSSSAAQSGLAIALCRDSFGMAKRHRIQPYLEAPVIKPHSNTGLTRPSLGHPARTGVCKCVSN